MICPFRNPMARKMPISRVRSLTEAIMVVKTINEPMSKTTAEIPTEKRLKCLTVSIRDSTACLMAATFAAGKTSEICFTISSMGQELQKAATSIRES